jgi:tetratricopeptide (TPR) repeat protein
VLYDLRGEMLASSHDYSTALPYFEKVSSLWPQWLKSYIQQARIQTLLQKFSAARELYNQVLQVVPNHPIAKVELGLIEFNQFQQAEKAYTLISSGLNQGDRLPANTESSGYLVLSKIYLQQGQKRRALQAAQKAFAANSSNNEARQLIISLGGADTLLRPDGREQLFVGDQYAKAGDCLAAQAEYRAIFDADNKNAVAAMKAGQCLWQLNQSQDAVDWLQKAVRADPKLMAAYILLADYYTQRFDFYAASKVLERARQIVPRSYEIYRGYALLELRRNNFKGAIDWAQKALQLYDSDIDTSVLMAKAQLGAGHFSEAQRYVNRAIEMDVNNTEAQSLKAKIMASLQGVEAGIHYAQELINTYPYTTEYRLALAEIYVQDERWTAAEVTYRQVISIDANNKMALMGLAKVLQREGHNNDALEMYLRAAILDPSDANPIFMVGQLYYQTGKYADAATQFQRVLRVNGRYPRGHLSLGQTALAIQNPKLALQEANAEKAINPEMADAYILAAEADYALKQFSSCAVEFQKALSKQVQETSVYVRMARCYRRSGALDSALSLLNQASGRESGNAQIYKELGAVYQTKSMADEAIEAYNKYLTLMPNAPDRRVIELQINQISNGSFDFVSDTTGGAF